MNYERISIGDLSVAHLKNLNNSIYLTYDIFLIVVGKYNSVFSTTNQLASCGELITAHLNNAAVR